MAIVGLNDELGCVCVYSYLSIWLTTGKGNYSQEKTWNWIGDHCMSYTTGFFSPRQSIWDSTGFPSMALLSSVAVDIFSSSFLFFNACFLIELRKWQKYIQSNANSIYQMLLVIKIIVIFTKYCCTQYYSNTTYNLAFSFPWGKWCHKSRDWNHVTGETQIWVRLRRKFHAWCIVFNDRGRLGFLPHKISFFFICTFHKHPDPFKMSCKGLFIFTWVSYISIRL